MLHDCAVDCFLHPSSPSTLGLERRFRFHEILAFNVPFTPKVDLTGRVDMTRGPDGLISSSREFWDQSVLGVLKTVFF